MIEGITDKQALFNHVARHLLKQREQSLRQYPNNRESCAYRGNRGLRCSIGCLIDDDNYNPVMEDMSLTTIAFAVENSIGRPLQRTYGYPSVSVDSEFSLLDVLRRVHDNWDPSDWFVRLNEVVDEFRLERIPELQGAPSCPTT